MLRYEKWWLDVSNATEFVVLSLLGKLHYIHSPLMDCSIAGPVTWLENYLSHPKVIATS